MTYPSFDDARCQFIAFLTSHGRPTDLLWLTRDDVVVVGHRLFVTAVADNGEAVARERYAQAVVEELGVCLSALALVGEQCGCTVYAPSGRHEAERALMPNGLKLQVSDKLFRARPVRSLVFNVLKRLESRNSVWDHALYELGGPTRRLALDTQEDARK